MRTIIIGAGFGGLSAAKILAQANLDVVLIDKNNYHLFQPLLYQVGVSALSPGDIAYPIRTIFRKFSNVITILDEVAAVDLKARRITLSNGDSLDYDYLVLAPGSVSSFFGREEWMEFAIPLKSLKDALLMRERILFSFELAEKKIIKGEDIASLLTFVIVGGGPTGVELSGAIAELIYKTILPDFPLLKGHKIRIILIDNGSRLISTFPEDLSSFAKDSLEKLGVEILLETRVVDIKNEVVETTKGRIQSANIFWAAGNSASPLLKSLGVKLDKQGRVFVNKDLSVPGFPDAFVIGDSACFIADDGVPLPGIAPVAIQQGEYVAKVIQENIPFGLRPNFVYRDKGTMATIGKAKAVAVLKGQKYKGFFAWILWSFVHILFLIGFRNKIRVMIEWIWYYITNKSGARLIVNHFRKK